MKRLIVALMLIGNVLLANEVIKNEKILPITVYVVRNGDSERSIHRVFLTEKAAKRYCDEYKDSHNYECEAIVLKE